MAVDMGAGRSVYSGAYDRLATAAFYPGANPVLWLYRARLQRDSWYGSVGLA